MSKKSILVAIIVACLAILVYLSLSGGSGNNPPALPSFDPGAGSSEGPSANSEGKTMAPDFTLPALDGKQIQLSAQKGKVVLVNFWSATCGPCIMEIPSLERLNQAMAGKPFIILSITPDSRSMAQDAAEQLGMRVPVLLDEEARVAMKYGVYATPETFIIAPDGSVNNKVVGAANWSDQSVIDYINSLLASVGTPPSK